MGQLRFSRVVKPSGNRTLRAAFLNFPATSSQADPILNELVALGCDYEGVLGG